MAVELANSQWGTIEVEPLESNRITGRTVGAPTLEVDRRRYVWRPEDEIRRELPDGYCVPINVMSRQGEGRRFYPDDPYSFVLNASLGGLAILTHVKNLDGEHRNTYNLMRLVFQYGPLVRERLNRTFKRAVDLMVLGTPRRELECKDILPESLGRDALGKGERWTIWPLKEAGRKEAKARELRRFSNSDVIRLGLLAAARRNPVDTSRLTTDEASGLLRLALFDLGPADVPVDEATKQEVIGRFQESLRSHLADAVEDFNEWFFHNRDGIVKQVSTRKSGPRPIERTVVREVLLELVFLALRYTGQCVDVQMRAFVEEIDPPLNPDEKAIFELCYFGQPWLAGIPLVVLYRYFAPIREAIQDLWADPGSSKKAGVLLRVLQYHAEMVSKRRQADRVAQQMGAVPEPRKTKVSANTPDDSEEDQLFRMSDLGTKLIGDSNVKCECGAELDFSGFDFASATEETVPVECVCSGCGAKQRRPFSFEEASKALRAMAE